MPAATFISEETKKAFYEKNNKKLMERYYTDPDFKKKLLDARNALHQKQKELKIGDYSPEGIARRAELAKIRNQRKKEENAEEKAKKKAEKLARTKEYKKEWYQRKKEEKLAENGDKVLVV
jgi:hypothetical protein